MSQSLSALSGIENCQLKVYTRCMKQHSLLLTTSNHHQHLKVCLEIKSSNSPITGWADWSASVVQAITLIWLGWLVVLATVSAYSLKAGY